MARTKKETLKVRFVDLTDYDNLDKNAYAEAYIYAVYGVNIREWWEIVRDFGIENVREEASRRVRQRTKNQPNITQKVKDTFENSMREGKRNNEYNPQHQSY